MSNSKIIRFIGFLCFCFLAFALYLQHLKGIQACPLCITQRYAFAAILIFCLIARLSFLYRLSTFLAFLSSVAGAIAAGYQMWTVKSANFQCQGNPVVDFIIQAPPSRWLPFLFKPNSVDCSGSLTRILGLTIPTWTLMWFTLFALILFFIAVRRRI